MLQMFYHAPASCFEEALPLGNGRLGAMIYGGTDLDTIAINEDTLWSGYPKDHNILGSEKILEKARQLVDKGCYKEAEALLEEGFLGEYSEAYLPLGTLRIDWGHGDAEDYSRLLDLQNAQAQVSYRCGQTRYQRSCFCSAPDQVLVYDVRAEGLSRLSARLTMDSPLAHSIRVCGDTLILDVEAPGHVKPRYIRSRTDEEDVVQYSMNAEERGMLATAMLRIETDGWVGSRGGDCHTLCLENATYATLYLSANTSFSGFDRQPYTNGKECKGLTERQLNAAMAKGYDALFATHVEDHRRYFDRVSLQIGKPINQPLDVMSALQSGAHGHSQLFEIVFQYGRYLLLASSRPGTQPPNLQGIWNEAIRPMWSCNYTTNINLQMNYWPVYTTNLAEMAEPLVRFTQEVAIRGRDTARAQYSAPGFVLHHNSDLWRMTSPCGKDKPDAAKACFWNMAGGWLCMHLWEHCLFTADVAYLRETAFPIMLEAARFYLACQTKNERGEWAHSPSTSPENSMRYEGGVASATEAPTMTVAILRHLYTLLLEAADILHTNDPLLTQVREVLPKLPAYQIGSKGQLLEWEKEFEETEPNHRHFSHLIGLFPGWDISPRETPELAEAVKTSHMLRGMEGTGWSLAWKVCQWAHLGNGQQAFDMLSRYLQLSCETSPDNIFSGGGVSPNLMSVCPPIQIDGNFGVTAAIAEMLMQSSLRDGQIEIDLLPALPMAWPEGCVKGLCARGGVLVDIHWTEGVLERAVLCAKEDGGIRVRYRSKTKSVRLKKGQQVSLNKMD